MLDAIDRQLIAATQAGLPLTREPYRALAVQLGIDEADVLARLQNLLNRGAIRRILRDSFSQWHGERDPKLLRSFEGRLPVSGGD